MSTPKLDQILSVKLRTVWKSEKDFTKWLAESKNLDSLAKALGLKFDSPEIEKLVGSHSADIVCVEEDLRFSVVIENQLTRSDHRHLGQIMTYAAGLDAGIGVWIAEEFGDDHRAAAEWFNDSNQTGLRLFAVKIELWKIGDSAPAPRFDVVVQPNEWKKSVRSRAGDHPDAEATLDLWRRVDDHIQSDDGISRPTPWAEPWQQFRSSTKPSAVLRGSFSKQKHQLRAYMLLSGPGSRQLGELLLNGASQFGELAELHPELETKPGGRSTSISIYLKGVEPLDPERRDDHARWLYNTLNTLRSTLWDQLTDTT